LALFVRGSPPPAAGTNWLCLYGQATVSSPNPVPPSGIWLRLFTTASLIGSVVTPLSCGELGILSAILVPRCAAQTARPGTQVVPALVVPRGSHFRRQPLQCKKTPVAARMLCKNQKLLRNSGRPTSPAPRTEDRGCRREDRGRELGPRCRATAKSHDLLGWQRQAEFSEFGDGGFPVRTTIAKPLGRDTATRFASSMHPFRPGTAAVAVPGEFPALGLQHGTATRLVGLSRGPAAFPSVAPGEALPAGPASLRSALRLPTEDKGLGRHAVGE
jgi:hypothetical protein